MSLFDDISAAAHAIQKAYESAGGSGPADVISGWVRNPVIVPPTPPPPVIPPLGTIPPPPSLPPIPDDAIKAKQPGFIKIGTNSVGLGWFIYVEDVQRTYDCSRVLGSSYRLVTSMIGPWHNGEADGCPVYAVPGYTDADLWAAIHQTHNQG